jgi:plastocyanin
VTAVLRRVTGRTAPYAFLGVLLSLVLLPLLAASPALAAKTVTIDITADGPKPASTTAAVGDTIVFRNADMTFVHQVRSKSTNWTFNSGPLAPGQTYPVGKLAKAGTYEYQGANLDSFTGKIVVPGSTPAPAPSATRSAAPAPSKSAAASPAAASASASASPTGGTGAVGPPPLAGGFGTVGVPSPPPGATGPAPAVAPTLAGEEVASAAPSGETVAIGTGRLPEPPTGRRYGLPAALAAVAAAGVASLLVRLLLAHPAARRAKHARGNLTVTVD